MNFLKNKLFYMIFACVFLFFSLSINAYAKTSTSKNSLPTPIEKDIHLRGWVLDSKGWRYYLYNNDYYKSSWQWINTSDYKNAYAYCFDDTGYIYTNTITPDGYFVNADGQWYDATTFEIYTKKNYEIYTSITSGPSDNITQNNTESSAVINTTGKPISSGSTGSTSKQLRNNITEMQNVSIVDKLEINGNTYKNLICFESDGAWLTLNMGKYTRLKLNATVKDSYIDDTYYQLTVYVNDEEVDTVEFDKEKYENLTNPTKEYILDCEENDLVMLQFSCTQTNKWLKKKLYITSGVLQK